MGKRELVALLCKSSWCLVIVVRLFTSTSMIYSSTPNGRHLPMPRVCLQFVIVVFPDHTH